MAAKIKICGMMSQKDIEHANETQPDFVGYIFAEGRRKITYQEAERFTLNLSDKISAVGVFADDKIENIVSIYKTGIIHLAQLHGNENEEYIKELKDKCGITIIKAVKAINPQNVQKTESSSADYILFDAKTAGSGKAFDHSLIRGVKGKFFIAGGIDNTNINEALSHKPYCVDISSGAETLGVKDKNKMALLVRAAHGE